MTPPRYGLDTGFFFLLFDGAERARDVWSEITAGTAPGVVSTLSVYELQRNALKGVLVREDVDAFLEELPHLCTMHESLSTAAGRRAARLGWGNGLAMADALLLQAFLDEEVTHILTTDRDFTAYDGTVTVEVLS
jgi:predicted nucleic acid-binding protein